MTVGQVSALMNKQGGLLGLCGNRDMRDTMEGYRKGQEGCTQAIEKYIYEIQKYIGAYTAALNGVDGIVFTAGVGENERTIRELILENFTYLGLKLDEAANEANETIITTADSKVAALVIHTDEEKVIASDTFDILNGKS